MLKRFSFISFLFKTSLINSINCMDQLLKDLKTHEQENDISLIQCWAIAIRDPFTICTAFSPGIDDKAILQFCYEAIARDLAEALLAFRTISDCYQTERFVESWKILVQ